MSEIFTIYGEMTPQELAKEFNRTINAVNVGISRMAKEHPEYKIKTGRRVKVTSEGVAWLKNYFRIDNSLALVDEEKIELQGEIRKLSALLEQSEKSKEEMRADFKERLAEQAAQAQQTFLIEQESKQKQIERLEQEKADQVTRADAAEAELAAFKALPWWKKIRVK